MKDQKDDRVITNVYNWDNGMTMVFDQYGQQMPEFQGRTEEVMPKIRAAGFETAVPVLNYRELFPYRNPVESA